MVCGSKFHTAGKNVTPYMTEDSEILQQQIIDYKTNQYTDAVVLPPLHLWTLWRYTNAVIIFIIIITLLTAYLSTDCKLKY